MPLCCVPASFRVLSIAPSRVCTLSCCNRRPYIQTRDCLVSSKEFIILFVKELFNPRRTCTKETSGDGEFHDFVMPGLAMLPAAIADTRISYYESCQNTNTKVSQTPRIYQEKRLFLLTNKRAEKKSLSLTSCLAQPPSQSASKSSWSRFY